MVIIGKSYWMHIEEGALVKKVVYETKKLST